MLLNFGIWRGGNSSRASVGMLSNPAFPCQNGRFFSFRSIRVSGRKGGDRGRSVKKRAGKPSVWNISPPRSPFSCGKNGISLLKEIYYLPQRREFLAAKKFPKVWKAGKNGASDGFFLLVGGRPRAKSVCPFASLPCVGLTRRRKPTARYPVADGKVSRKPVFPFHPAFPRGRETRAFPSVPRLTPVGAILAGAVLTF